MGRRFVDMRTIARRMQGKDDRINRALRKAADMKVSEEENGVGLIVTRPPTGPAVTADHLQLIKATIAKDATPAELQLFLYDNARQGVHPLDKLIHFTKRSGKYTPITSIDFMRIRAAESGECAGIDDAIFTGTPKGKDFAATTTVYRLVHQQRCAFTATARWSEYKPDANAFMWEKMPHTMLAKCSEGLALRKAFPKQLAGLFTREEMEQASPASARGSSPRALESETATEGAAAVPANHNSGIPDSWRPFITGEAMTGAIVDVVTEQKDGRKAGQPHTYVKTVIVLEGGVEFYKIDDPALTAQARAHQEAGERVTIMARETSRGHEIQSLAVATDAAF